MTSPEAPAPPEPPASPEPSSPSPDGSGSDPGWGLRGPRGCAEWTVVILGVIWVALAIVFVVALIVRLSG